MARTPIEQFERVHPADRAAWRAWLSENHATSPGIWLIYDKRSTRAERLLYAEAVEEALCFGWIDSKPNRIDADTYMQLFTPRKPTSGWSRINQQRVERLTANGLMTPAGLTVVEAARASGRWQALDEVEALTMPSDLANALATNSAAERYFGDFPPSSKKIIFTWIASAKQAGTRASRIAETVRLAAENQRANHYRQPGERR